ncbi:MAG: translation initiation factor IF-1 [Patescibacteria group bacterium]|nr:translation initiation factor IF-1 [Patescibacteria group bacterium]
MDMQAIEGIVKEALPGLTFRVALKRAKASEDVSHVATSSPVSSKDILAHLAGKMKLHRIRVLPGDKVLIEVGPDGRRGRIVRRL